MALHVIRPGKDGVLTLVDGGGRENLEGEFGLGSIGRETRGVGGGSNLRWLAGSTAGKAFRVTEHHNEITTLRKRQRKARTLIRKIVGKNLAKFLAAWSRTIRNDEKTIWRGALSVDDFEIDVATLRGRGGKLEGVPHDEATEG